MFTKNVGINPNLENDKKTHLKIEVIVSELDTENFNDRFDEKNFYIKKNYHLKNTIKFFYQEKSSCEQKITRVYPHENLFSHVLGQIDDDNGISGLENI